MFGKLFLFFLVSLSSFAQEGGGGSGFAGIKGVKVNLHKENFFSPATYHSPPGHDARNDVEIQFQFSLKLSLIGGDHQAFNFAYTQKSFWQVYSKATSRPFRDSNYNPEFFLRLGGATFFFDTGYEHESNGEVDPKSRSWDRAYIKLHFRRAKFKMSLKYWFIGLEEIHGPDQEERKDPMVTYMGRGEASMAFMLGSTIFKTTGRYNPSTGYGYVDNKLMLPIFKKFYFYLQHARGYGHSLRDYNRFQQVSGFGLLLNP